MLDCEISAIGHFIFPHIVSIERVNTHGLVYDIHGESLIFLGFGFSGIFDMWQVGHGDSIHHFGCRIREKEQTDAIGYQPCYHI